MKIKTYSLAALLALSGCTLYKTRDLKDIAETPVNWSQVSPDKGQLDPDLAWWYLFKDDQLNELMEKAFSNNLTLEQAFARLNQFDAIARQAKSVRLPQVNLKGSKSRNKSNSIMGVTIGETESVSLSAGFEVDLWGKLKAKNEARSLEYQASREDLQSIMLTLSAQVADTYFLLAEQNEQLQLAISTRDARSETVDFVMNRYREGIVSALDVYQAKQALAAAKARIPKLEQAVAVASHALSVLIGELPKSEQVASVHQLPAMADWFPKGLPSELLLNRPDIRAQMNRLKSSDLEVGAAIADRFPSINLVGEYGHSSSDFGTSLSGTVWSLLGNLAMPVLDWGGRKSEVERRKALFAEKLAAYKESVLSAFKEVEDALVSQQKVTEMIGYEKEEVAAAQSALNLAKSQYLDGVTGYLSVLTSQVYVYDAKTRLLASRRELISHRISLARSLGGTWMTPYIEKREMTQEEKG